MADGFGDGPHGLPRGARDVVALREGRDETPKRIVVEQTPTVGKTRLDDASRHHRSLTATPSGPTAVAHSASPGLDDPLVARAPKLGPSSASAAGPVHDEAAARAPRSALPEPLPLVEPEETVLASLRGRSAPVTTRIPTDTFRVAQTHVFGPAERVVAALRRALQEHGIASRWDCGAWKFRSMLSARDEFLEFTVRVQLLDAGTSHHVVDAAVTGPGGAGMLSFLRVAEQLPVTLQSFANDLDLRVVTSRTLAESGTASLFPLPGAAAAAAAASVSGPVSQSRLSRLDRSFSGVLLADLPGASEDETAPVLSAHGSRLGDSLYSKFCGCECDDDVLSALSSAASHTSDFRRMASQSVARQRSFASSAATAVVAAPTAIAPSAIAVTAAPLPVAFPSASAALATAAAAATPGTASSAASPSTLVPSSPLSSWGAGALDEDASVPADAATNAAADASVAVPAMSPATTRGGPASAPWVSKAFRFGSAKGSATKAATTTSTSSSSSVATALSAENSWRTVELLLAHAPVPAGTPSSAAATTSSPTTATAAASSGAASALPTPSPANTPTTTTTTSPSSSSSSPLMQGANERHMREETCRTLSRLTADGAQLHPSLASSRVAESLVSLLLHDDVHTDSASPVSSSASSADVESPTAVPLASNPTNSALLRTRLAALATLVNLVSSDVTRDTVLAALLRNGVPLLERLRAWADDRSCERRGGAGGVPTVVGCQTAPIGLLCLQRASADALRAFATALTRSTVTGKGR